MADKVKILETKALTMPVLVRHLADKGVIWRSNNYERREVGREKAAPIAPLGNFSGVLRVLQEAHAALLAPLAKNAGFLDVWAERMRGSRCAPWGEDGERHSTSSTGSPQASSGQGCQLSVSVRTYCGASGKSNWSSRWRNQCEKKVANLAHHNLAQHRACGTRDMRIGMEGFVRITARPTSARPPRKLSEKASYTLTPPQVRDVATWEGGVRRCKNIFHIFSALEFTRGQMSMLLELDIELPDAASRVSAGRPPTIACRRRRGRWSRVSARLGREICC